MPRHLDAATKKEGGGRKPCKCFQEHAALVCMLDDKWQNCRMPNQLSVQQDGKAAQEGRGQKGSYGLNADGTTTEVLFSTNTG